MHGSRLDEFHARLPQWGRRMLRRTLERADRIIAPGSHWRGVLVDTVGIDASLVRVIANAAAGPAHVAPRPARPICELVFLGNLSPRKGLPELLRALAQPDVAALAWRLCVAGDGDAGPYVAQATALGIADRVDFVGWVAEARVRELLTAADVFVLPSHHEGLSIGMLEAMAHGCAIVATPVGATLDAVRDGESALLVPPGDAPRLAAALQRVIADPQLRAALQAGARQRWSDGFDIAGHCRQVAALYRELCEPPVSRHSLGARHDE
jgi:glycosyltransferase involved in cell wall biosynthesis